MFDRKHRKTLGRRVADTHRSGLPLDLLYWAFVAGVLVGIVYMRRANP